MPEALDDEAEDEATGDHATDAPSTRALPHRPARPASLASPKTTLGVAVVPTRGDPREAPGRRVSMSMSWAKAWHAGLGEV